jgi:hypothetical protein
MVTPILGNPLPPSDFPPQATKDSATATTRKTIIAFFTFFLLIKIVFGALLTPYLWVNFIAEHPINLPLITGK